MKKNELPAKPGNKGLKIIAGFSLALAFLPGMWAGVREEKTAVQRVSMGVSEACVLNAEGNPGRLNVNIERLAGIQGPSDLMSEVYIQYSIIAARQQSRTLTARMEGPGSLPSGCSLTLEALPSGKKNEGIGAGRIVLSAIPQAILKDIGSCATGTAPTDGARLVFQFTGGEAARRAAGEGSRATVVLEFM